MQQALARVTIEINAKGPRMTLYLDLPRSMSAVAEPRKIVIGVSQGGLPTAEYLRDVADRAGVQAGQIRGILASA